MTLSREQTLLTLSATNPQNLVYKNPCSHLRDKDLVFFLQVRIRKIMF